MLGDSATGKTGESKAHRLPFAPLNFARASWSDFQSFILTKKKNHPISNYFSAREPIHDLGVHAHLRCIARRWVRREDCQHPPRWRRIRNDFHRSSGQRDERKFRLQSFVSQPKLSICHFSFVQQVENSLSTYEPHACIIVYSIVQRSSLRCAEEILNYLWRENVTKDKAVIVVGLVESC